MPLFQSEIEKESLQADVNKAADDFDEILRKSRASLEVNFIGLNLYSFIWLAVPSQLQASVLGFWQLDRLLQNDKAEFEMFERMVEKDRNRHLFFQDLYKRELRKKQSNSKKKARSEASRKPVPSFEYEPKQVSLCTLWWDHHWN